MDNKTLKAFVVKHKISGLTYQQISDILAEEHNTIRSRQALQGMYQRAVNTNKSEEFKDKLIATADIVNIHCLGYTMENVKELANQLGHSLSYNDIVVTIRNQKDYIEKVRESIIKRVALRLDSAAEMADIKDELKYREVEPTEKKLKLYIAEAYKDNIGVEISRMIAKAYQFTDDMTVVRKIIKDLNVKVDMEAFRSSL